MPTGQNYATNVPQTTLTSQVNATTTTWSVASSTGWPTPPFTAVADIGTSTQEPVDVTNIVGTTWTVTRNIDGTSGFAHANGATITHADIGRDFREPRSHIDSAGPLDASSAAVHGLTNTAGNVVMGTKQTQTVSNKTHQAPIIDNTVPATPPANDIALYSNAGVLAVVDPAGTAFNVAQPVVTAAANALLSWSFDPMLCTQRVNAVNGVITLMKHYVVAPITVSNIVYTITGGSGMTAGQNFVGLYNASGTRIAVSADQSTNFASTAVISAAVGPVALEPGVYYVAYLANTGTTNPQFSSATNAVSSGDPSANVSTAARFSTILTGQTSLPASLTISSAARSATPTWSGLS